MLLQLLVIIQIARGRTLSWLDRVPPRLGSCPPDGAGLGANLVLGQDSVAQGTGSVTCQPVFWGPFCQSKFSSWHSSLDFCKLKLGLERNATISSFFVVLPLQR